MFEYGAMAFVLAAFGYMARHHTDREQLFRYAVFVCLGYVFLQCISVGLFGAKFFALTLGVALVTTALFNFKAKTYPALGEKLGGVGRGIVQLCGRHTLEIYVGHLLVFKTIAVLIGAKGYEFMNWSWVW